MGKSWKRYILRGGDGSLYTGITVDVQARRAQHRDGTGAKYTRGRGPVELIYVEDCEDHSVALKREHQIKALTRAEKLALIQSKEKR